MDNNAANAAPSPSGDRCVQCYTVISLGLKNED